MNQLELREDIAKGERIQAYQLQVKIKGKWQQLLCEGTSVGNKRIQTFKPVKSSTFKLVITKSKAGPIVYFAALYNISDTTIRN